jgi:hypothetical protein
MEVLTINCCMIQLVLYYDTNIVSQSAVIQSIQALWETQLPIVILLLRAYPLPRNGLCNHVTLLNYITPTPWP